MTTTETNTDHRPAIKAEDARRASTYRVDILRVIPGASPDAPEKYQWESLCRGSKLGGVSVQPLLDACRAIKRALFDDAEGPVQGTAHLYRHGDANWSARCAIEWGAFHRVDETRAGRLRLVTWYPHPQLNAAVRGAVPSPMRQNANLVSHHTPIVGAA